MADWHGGVRGGGRMVKMGSHEDFQEDEVWSIMGSREGSSNSKAKKNTSPSSSVRRFTSPREIPRGGGGGGGGGQSAPVETPDWSKILKKKTKKDSWDDACHNKAHGDVEDTDDDHVEAVHDNDDVDDDEEEMVPPHEYLARKLASTQIASFSMCEGVGRTLKGRDLSKVRNAILTKTGFLE